MYCATNEIFNQITHLFENAVKQAVFLFVRWINIIRWIIVTIFVFVVVVTLSECVPTHLHQFSTFDQAPANNTKNRAKNVK